MKQYSVSIRAIALAVLLFITLSILSTLPLALNPGDTFPGSIKDNDMRFNLWVIYWGYHALVTNPLELHHANIFYPELNTFVYSDIELSHSILMAPFIALTVNPEFVYNMLIILSLVIGGVGWYLFCLRLCSLHSAAIAGAIIIQFSAARFGRYTQIQFFGDHWLPWALLALWFWLTDRRRKTNWLWAVLSALFFSLHALSGSHNAIFGAIIIVVCGLFLFVRNKHFARKDVWIQLAVVIVLIVAALAPVFIPYFIVSDDMVAHRVASQENLRVGSARAVEFFSSDSRFYRWLDESAGWPTRILDQKPRGSLWPGLLPIVVLFMGVFGPALSKRFKDDDARMSIVLVDLFVIISVICLLFTVFILPAQPGPGQAFATSPIVWLGMLSIVAVIVRATIWRDQKQTLVILLQGAARSFLFKPLPLVWFGMLLFSIWASLGPDGWLYNYLSGLPAVSLIRVPRRFFLIGLIALGVLASYSLASLREKYKDKKKRYFILLALLLMLFALESNYAPLKVYPVEKPHPLYTWLGSQPGEFTILEYPVGATDYAAAIRQTYASIYHWKNLIVGYSGYQSKENIKLLTWLNRRFPEKAAIDKLTELDTRFVIVMRNRLNDEKRLSIEESVNKGMMKPVKTFGEIVVYQLNSWSE